MIKIAIFIICGFAILLFLYSVNQSPKTFDTSGISVINANILEERIGLADYVFIGYVDSKGDSFEKFKGMPLTSYNITVVENIKGNIKKNSSLDMLKDGGVTDDGKYLIINENDFMPETGEYYLFIAAGQSDGNILITSQEEFSNYDSKSDIKSSSEYKIYLNAYNNEMIFERKRFKSKHEESR